MTSSVPCTSQEPIEEVTNRVVSPKGREATDQEMEARFAHQQAYLDRVAVEAENHRRLEELNGRRNGKLINYGCQWDRANLEPPSSESDSEPDYDETDLKSLVKRKPVKDNLRRPPNKYKNTITVSHGEILRMFRDTRAHLAATEDLSELVAYDDSSSSDPNE